MSLLSSVSVDQIMLSFLAIFALREGMIAFLPDGVAGPGGWLVDTTVEN